MAPPARSTADDQSLNSLLALESDIVATYAAAKTKTSGDDLAALELIEKHHLAYAQAIEGYLGRAATAQNGSAQPVAGATYAEIARSLARIEGQAVQSHIQALGSIKGLDAANLVASIITVEARHRAALLVSAGGSVNAIAGN